MRLLLDTTYFLPAIGVLVKGLPKDAPIKLIRLGHRISMSEITVFELAAKGAKYVVTGRLKAERITRGIKAVVYDERITKIPLHDSTILLTAFRLRRFLSDFIDCLILSSAVNRSDALITEDEDIRNLGKRELQEIFQAVNPEFRIQTLKDVL